MLHFSIVNLPYKYISYYREEREAERDREVEREEPDLAERYLESDREELDRDPEREEPERRDILAVRFITRSFLLTARLIRLSVLDFL